FPTRRSSDLFLTCKSCSRKFLVLCFYNFRLWAFFLRSFFCFWLCRFCYFLHRCWLFSRRFLYRLIFLFSLSFWCNFWFCLSFWFYRSFFCFIRIIVWCV